MIVSMNTLHECALKGMLLQGNHNVLIYLCVDVNGEVKDLHRQFNIIYIMRTNINQGRIQSLAVHDCSAH